MNGIVSRTLIIELLDYWHCGSGRGEGSHLDAIVERDSNGLPFVSGRMLKGLLRDAVRCLEAWGAKTVAAGDTDNWFGKPARQAETRHESEPGKLRVSDARLPEDFAMWFATRSAEREELFREVFATAIDPRTGAALRGSLRGTEVVIPLVLECELAGPAGLDAALSEALPLVRAIGAHRSRGLGRASLRWKQSTGGGHAAR